MVKMVSPTSEIFDPQVLTPHNLLLYHFLMENDQDRLKFSQMWRCKEKQSMAIMEFRSMKIAALNVQFPELQDKFEIDPLGSLEYLFQHPVDQEDCDYVIGKIKENKYNLEDIFTEHKKSPTYKLMRIILSM